METRDFYKSDRIDQTNKRENRKCAVSEINQERDRAFENQVNNNKKQGAKVIKSN